VNYVIAVVQALLGIAVGPVVHFILREPAGDCYAFIAAVMVAWALPLVLEIWFRRSDH
jgi:hypothetical protein